jgi:hypothetical protein
MSIVVVSPRAFRSCPHGEGFAAGLSLQFDMTAGHGYIGAGDYHNDLHFSFYSGQGFFAVGIYIGRFWKNLSRLPPPPMAYFSESTANKNNSRN